MNTQREKLQAALMSTIDTLELSFDGYEIDLGYALSNCDNYADGSIELDDFVEKVDELISQTDVFYFDNAMSILSEHDSSLVGSLSLACDMGYTPENLNSELLATILVQSELQGKFWGMMSKLERIIEAYNNGIAAIETEQE